MKKNMMPLPNELLILILLRLPVKSLLRLRCVCKLWLSLISDRHFAKSHFELASAPTHRLVLLKSSLSQTRSIDLDASLHDDSASAVTKLSFQLPTPCVDVEILGSCRGFLLLWGGLIYSEMYLWNPSTSLHEQLPLSPIVSDMNSSFFTYLHGFGYDPSTDDYLVVVASYDTTSVDCATQFEFFSLRANSWKKIEGAHLPYMNCSDEPRGGSLLNGALHWLAFRRDVSVDLILVFDLVERSFSEIPLPDDLECELEDCDLWVHGGLLSLCVQGWGAAEIWVMEEYKVQSSWTKSIVVPYDDIPTQYFSAICTTKSGDIFGYDGSEGLVKCNAEGEVLEYRSYPHEGEAANVHTRAAMYIESLLSLPGDNGQAQDE